MDQFYVYISSNDCTKIYPDNNTKSFIISLPHALNLHGQWSVGLVDINLKVIKNPANTDMYVCCNVVVDSYSNGGCISSLRRLYKPRGLFEKYFNPVQYVPVVNTHEIQHLHFNILNTENLQPALFVKDPLKATLHFKRDRPASLI